MKLALISLLFIPALLSAQPSADSISYSPRFDLHLGVAFVSGAKIGARAMVIENVSFETSYGSDVFEFVRFTSSDERFTLGANWHFSESKNFVLSLLGTRIDYAHQAGESYIISLNIGTLSMAQAGIHHYVRAGLAIEYKYTSGFRRNFGPNLDAGINWVFP